jgi:hypothetical protein
MVTYEVTAIVEPGLVEAYEHYMREHHIPAVLASDCFQGAVFTRATPGRYRMRYEVRSDEDLDRYLTTYAPLLREDFASSFPEGVVLSREVWMAIQSWDTPHAAG